MDGDLSSVLSLLLSITLKCIGYGLLFLLTVCFVAGSDAGNMSKGFSWQFRLAAALRTPILVFLVVPLSFLLNTYRSIRMYIRAGSISAMGKDGHDELMKKNTEEHAKRVDVVVQQIQKWNDDGRTKTMRTARPNWSQMSLKLGSNKGSSHQIYTQHLNHILNIDEEKMTVTCEPSVTMGEITNALLPRKLALMCQVEMESLTIGGLSMGFGMETNSHVIGWLQETVTEFEIVTAEQPHPQVRKVTRETDPDIFYALPHSVGTLGFLVSVTVRLTRTKPFVHMRYIMTKSPQELCDKMTSISETAAAQTNAQDYDDRVAPQFLEATCYSKDTAVIQCGMMVDEKDIAEMKQKKEYENMQLNRINLWYKPFYYKWLEYLLERCVNDPEKYGSTYDEIIPLKHYYHRFTRSIFWEIEDMIPFSNHPLYRFFWGWLGAPEVSLLKLFQGPVIRKNSVYAHVIQESIMPVRKLAEGIKKFEEWWDIYPLLVFPLRTYDRGIHSGFLNPRGNNLAPAGQKKNGDGEGWGIFVDLAAYGVPKVVREGGDFDAKTVVRKFEEWTREQGGFMAYYTDIFCTRKEYKMTFDHTLWEQARKRLNADDAFPEPYDKNRSEPGIVDLSAEEAAEAKQKQQKETKRVVGDENVEEEKKVD